MSDLPTEHNQTSAVLEAVRAGIAKVNVSLPATVQSYDRTTQTAVVAVVPCSRRRNGNDDTTCYRPDPVSVPVAFPGSGPYSITWELAAGEEGHLIICDRSIGEWKSTGAAQTTPVDFLRRHNLSDGVFHPGLRSPANALESTAYDAMAMVIAGDLIKMGDSSATDKVALDTLVQAELSALAAAITAAPTFAAAKIAITALVTGGWPASVGADKVQAT